MCPRRSSKRDKWWWQFTVLMRQLALALVVGLTDLDSPIVPLAVLSVLMSHLTLLTHHWPHRVIWYPLG